MQLQKNPNGWSCLPTSFAMCIDMSVEELITDIGHDGSKIIFPEYDEPFCRRSFHIQELTYALLVRKWAIIPLERNAISATIKGSLFKLTDIENKWFQFLEQFNSVFLAHQNGITHAVAWDKKQIYDPRGYIMSLETFEKTWCIYQFYICAKLL